MPPGRMKVLRRLAFAATSSVCSVAHATPQLRCPPGQEAHAPPGVVVVALSLLFTCAPLLLSVALAALYLRARRQDGEPPASFSARLGRSWLAVALVVLGLLGSALAVLFALFALVSGAWVRCV